MRSRHGGNNKKGRFGSRNRHGKGSSRRPLTSHFVENQICVKNVATGTIAVIKNLLQKRFEVFGEIGEISVIRLQNEAYVTFDTTAAATKTLAAYKERKEDGDWTLNGDVVSVELAICRGISISPLKTDADGGNVASTNDDEIIEIYENEIYVGNLSIDYAKDLHKAESIMQEVFRKFGTIIELVIKPTRRGNLCIGFVTFADAVSARTAMQQLDNKRVPVLGVERIVIRYSRVPDSDKILPGPLTGTVDKRNVAGQHNNNNNNNNSSSRSRKASTSNNPKDPKANASHEHRQFLFAQRAVTNKKIPSHLEKLFVSVFGFRCLATQSKIKALEPKRTGPCAVQAASFALLGLPAIAKLASVCHAMRNVVNFSARIAVPLWRTSVQATFGSKRELRFDLDRACSESGASPPLKHFRSYAQGCCTHNRTGLPHFPSAHVKEGSTSKPPRSRNHSRASFWRSVYLDLLAARQLARNHPPANSKSGGAMPFVLSLGISPTQIKFKDTATVRRLLGVQDGVKMDIRLAAAGKTGDSDWLATTQQLPVCNGIYEYSVITVHGQDPITFTIGWSTRGSWVGVFTYGVTKIKDTA